IFATVERGKISDRLTDFFPSLLKLAGEITWENYPESLGGRSSSGRWIPTESAIAAKAFIHKLVQTPKGLRAVFAEFSNEDHAIAKQARKLIEYSTPELIDSEIMEDFLRQIDASI